MALRLVPKVLNPVDVVLLVCKEFGVVDSKVLEVRNIQYVVGLANSLNRRCCQEQPCV